MDDLKKFWDETKIKLLKENIDVVEKFKVLHRKTNSEITKRLYRENQRKLKDSRKVVAEMDLMVVSAIYTGDRENADDAVFVAIERILQDEYVCIGDINDLKNLQPCKPGNNRQGCGMVRINGVFIPNGWIEPTVAQIQNKLTSLANGEISLRDMVALLPFETQDQRVPKNAPGALPYSGGDKKLDNSVMNSLDSSDDYSL